jgi:hypothetical protein
MDASQDAFLQEYFDWKAERDRQLASARNVMLRLQQRGVAKAFRSWLDATRQRKALVGMLRRWVQLELSERWAQWIRHCVIACALERESWVAHAQKAHDSGDWKLTRDTAERALSSGKNLLLLAHSSLPLSESNAVLALGAHTAASVLQELQDQEKVQADASDRALDLIESAVEAQRHHDSEVLTVRYNSFYHTCTAFGYRLALQPTSKINSLTFVASCASEQRACTRVALLHVTRAFIAWQTTIAGWRREAYIVDTVKRRWEKCVSSTLR